jgi:hypothetical protein
MRSPMTSRSNWANDNSTLRVSLPRFCPNVPRKKPSSTRRRGSRPQSPTLPADLARTDGSHTHRWREPEPNHRSRRERDGRGEAPRPTIVVSRDDLCLVTPSSLSVRNLPSATAVRPFATAGPMVRIRFPPAGSLRTIGSAGGRAAAVALEANRTPATRRHRQIRRLFPTASRANFPCIVR